ncbi:MAG TPA: 2-oxo-4-hydroxy-4-carboxy-5-ureidoimidazoline decarboxylase [Pyrinomonadaceae bacterium]|nr:2-oxo-4-hydroxy-4-carboxy-5-ureidoimidazoline decarboxylase [Pyrinomonadaceae bacterium]
MNYETLNALPPDEALKEFLKCCGSVKWAQAMVQLRQYATTIGGLVLFGNEMWLMLEPEDWLEAFRSHPKIGEKKAAAEVSTQSTQWSGQEQSGVQTAAQATLDEMAQLNREYEDKFGFIFIVCATGKSADEMLAMLRERLRNEPEVELRIAAAEQAKITELRLKKLVN